MKLFTRTMRVVVAVMALSALFALPAHGAPVPFGWPVVADQDSVVDTPTTDSPGRLISLTPLGSGQPGKQQLVAPDGAATAAGGTNYFQDPIGLVQRQDQIYDVVDRNATEPQGCAIEDYTCQTGAVIEVNLISGKQTLIYAGAPFVEPTGIIRDPATDDLLVIDRRAGTNHFGAIFRLHEDSNSVVQITTVHDGGAGASAGSPFSPQTMTSPAGIALEASGKIVVSDTNAAVPGAIYHPGAVFRIDPAVATNDGSISQRTAIAWSPNGAYDQPNEYFFDPEGLMVRSDGKIFVADATDSNSSSASSIVLVDPAVGTPPNQTLISRKQLFAGGLISLAPVNPNFAQNDDLYALDFNAGFDGSGAVIVVNPSAPLNVDANQPPAAYSHNGLPYNTLKLFIDPSAIVTAQDLPDPPLISVNTGGPPDVAGARVIEPAGCGAEGTPICDIVFQVRLAHTWTRTIKVEYTIGDVTAKTTDDYTNTAVSPVTIAFSPGQVVKEVRVPVKADLLHEDDETMRLTLSNAVIGLLDPIPARASALGTIVDDDPPPTLTISSPPDFIEADGAVSCIVNLLAPSGLPISVSWATADVTAVQPLDYTARSATINFAAGTSGIQQLPIPIVGDSLDEENETFDVNLSNPVGVTLGGTKCTATILDDDAGPKLSIRDVKSNEGNSGTRQLSMTVAMSGPSAKAVSVKWATADDAATVADNDYPAQTGILTIAAGQASGTINVKVNGDTKKEQDETFKVNLSSPVNSSILAGTGTVTIVNDDDDAVTPGKTPDPGNGVDPTTNSGGTKACVSRRTLFIRVKKTKLGTAKVVSATVTVNGKKVGTARTGKRLKAPVILKGLKKGRYKVVIKAKLSDGRTITDIRRFYTCRKKIVKKK